MLFADDPDYSLSELRVLLGYPLVVEPVVLRFVGLGVVT